MKKIVLILTLLGTGTFHAAVDWFPLSSNYFGAANLATVVYNAGNSNGQLTTSEFNNVHLPGPYVWPKFSVTPAQNPFLIAGFIQFNTGTSTRDLTAPGALQFDNINKTWLTGTATFGIGNNFGWADPVDWTHFTFGTITNGGAVNFDLAMDPTGNSLWAASYTELNTNASNNYYNSIVVSSALQNPLTVNGGLGMAMVPNGSNGCQNLKLYPIRTASISTLAHTYAFPQIAIDASGNGAVIFKEILFTNTLSAAPIYGAIFPSGGSWSGLTTLNPNGYSWTSTTQQIIHQIAAGGNTTGAGQIVAVWYDQTVGAFQSSSVLKSLGGWDTTQTIATTATPTLFYFDFDGGDGNDSGNGPSNIIAVGVDGQGIAHCLYTYTNPTPTIIAAKKLAADGTSWVFTATLSTPGATALHPRIAVKSDGTALGVWDENGTTIMASYYNGTSWQTTPFTVSTTPGAGYPQVAFDSNSAHAIVGWAENDPLGPPLFTGNPGIGALVSLFDGTSFSQEQKISSFWDGVGNAISLTAVDYSGSIPKIVFCQYGAVSLTSAIGTITPCPGNNVVTLPPQPVNNLTAAVVRDRFAFQTNLVTQLTWTASPTIGVTTYAIYKNGNLLGNFPSARLYYNDYDTTVGVTYTYAVVAQTATGSSAPVSLVFTR